MHFSDTLTDATSAVTSANASALAIRQVFEGGDNQVITMPDGTERNSVAKDVRERLDGLETQAMGFRDQAFAAADSIGPIQFYDTRAAADLGMTNLSEGDIVEVTTDESLGGSRVRYRVEGGVYVRKVVLSGVVPGSTTLETAEVLAAGGVIPPGTVLPVFYNGIIFDVRVEDDADALNPLGSRLRPVGPINVRMFGAQGDGAAGDFAKIQAAMDFAGGYHDGDRPFIAQKAGEDFGIVSGPNHTGVAGQSVIFPHDIYDFEGQRLIVPSFVTPVCEGEVVIFRGGFYWRGGATYNHHIRDFRVVDPPSWTGAITAITKVAATTVRGAHTRLRITSAGHGLVTGDYVRFRGVSGMYQLNYRGGVIEIDGPDAFFLDTRNRQYSPGASGSQGIEWAGDGWDATGWDDYVGGGDWRCGAAFEYETRNVARSTMIFENITIIGDATQYKAAGIIARDYHNTRSTATILRGCAFGGLATFVRAPTDSFHALSCFGYLETNEEPLYYSRGMTTIENCVGTPRIIGATIPSYTHAHWCAWDIAREPTGANSWVSRNSRWGGEGAGGISILRNMESAGDYSTSLNAQCIVIDGGSGSCLRGGRAENDGGAVILARTMDGAAVPNSISFRNFPTNAPGRLVQTEISDQVPAIPAGNACQISIDPASAATSEMQGMHPTPDNLIAYYDRATVGWMANRRQFQTTAAMNTPSLLWGSTMYVDSAGTRSLKDIRHAVPGDRFHVRVSGAVGRNFSVKHKEAGAAMQMHLQDGQNWTPNTASAGDTDMITLEVVADGVACEVARSRVPG